MTVHPSWADLVERASDPQVASHLDSCASCRAEVRLIGGIGERSPASLPGIDSARGRMADARRRAGEVLSRSLATEGTVGEDTAAELSPGTRIERYVVEARIGRGGMGTVYRVVHTQLGSQHALKVLHRLTGGAPDSVIAGKAERERLIREGQAQSRLRHPNIVRVTDVVEVDGAPGLIMELVDGLSLQAWFGQRGRPSVAEADTIGLGILRGVAAAHRAGVVHRDLKPSNVLLAPSDDGAFVPKVSDFGLARRLAEAGDTLLTRPGTPLGTPAYMAPEQIRDASAADERSDVFSLGAVLYELVSGRRAFGGLEVIEVYDAVRAGRYPPLPADVPTRMARAITRALAVDPAARFADVAQLLDVWRGAEPPVAASRRRWPWLAVPVAVGAIAIGGWSSWKPAVDAPLPPLERRATALPSELQIFSLAMSKDGSSLAYSDSRGVWLQAIGERSATKLLDGGPYNWLDFFPSGDRLMAAGRRDGRDAVWSLGTDGSDVRLVMPSSGRAVRLSPDGTRVAMMDGTGMSVVSLDDGHRTRLRPLAGADSTSDLVWSPSGRFVAAVHMSSTGDPAWLEVTAADGTSTRRLLEDPGLVSLTLAPLDWVEPDRLVFALSSYGQGPEVALYGLDGAETATDTTSRVLLHRWSGVNVTRLRASADGSSLAFFRVTGRPAIHVVPVDGSGAPPTRLPGEDWADTLMGWLDAEHVLLVSEEAALGLYAQPLDGLPATPIPADGIDWKRPVEVLDDALLYWAWSPPGKGTDLALIRAPRSGAEPTRLAAFPAPRSRQELISLRCRAGRCLLGERTDVGLDLSWIDPATGARGAAVYTTPIASRSLAWDLAPDGHHLALLRAEPGRLQVVDLDGGPSQEWPVDLNIAPHVAWAPSGDRLFLSGIQEASDRPYRLISFDLTGRSEILWSSISWYLYKPMPSPDGRNLAVGVYAFEDDIWVIDDLLDREGIVEPIKGP